MSAVVRPRISRSLTSANTHLRIPEFGQVDSAPVYRCAGLMLHIIRTSAGRIFRCIGPARTGWDVEQVNTACVTHDNIQFQLLNQSDRLMFNGRSRRILHRKTIRHESED
ncbi:hypothetical protein J6590_017510 [Homalodisca vitripennis]|nr:hypothetical protein J6590_017510 [Homalodisca vitripennis]